MLPEVEKLVLVQHRDQKIVALEKEIAGIPLEAEDLQDGLVVDEKSVAEAKLAMQQAEVAIKNVEIDVETRRDSVAKLKVQQFETKKNEEFRAMGDEIIRYGEEISDLEDKEIELMEEADVLKKTYQEANGKLEENKVSVAEELEDLKDLQKKLENDVTEEKAEREKLSTALDEDLLYGYDRLFKAKNGMAVVGLIDEVCHGCHMKVTKSTVIKVKAENEVANCENCGRILYWWTDDSVGKNMGEY